MPALPRLSVERSHRELTKTGRRIASFRCTNQLTPAELADTDTWILTAAYEGYVPIDDDDERTARLLSWTPGRADGRHTRVRIMRALAQLWDWWARGQRRLYSIGAQQLADRASADGDGPRIQRQTVVRVLREARRDGVLRLVRRGRSKDYSPTGRNEVSTYAVVKPNELDHEARTALGKLRKTAGQAVVAHPPVGVNSLPDLSGGRCLDLGRKSRTQRVRVQAPPAARPAREQHPELYVPRTAAERRVATMWIVNWLGWRLSPWQLANLFGFLGHLFAAGWTPLAVTVATGRQPDGHRHKTPVQNPEGMRERLKVFGWRVGLWREAGRIPTLPAPSRRGPQPAWLRAEQQHARPAAPPLPQRTGPTSAAVRAELAALRATLPPTCRARVSRYA